MSRWNHHPPCPDGCGELADECRCPRPNPLGSMTVHVPMTREEMLGVQGSENSPQNSAVPVLQAQERERIADMLQEFAEQWLYDGDHDQPLPGYLELHEIVRSLAVPEGERR